MSENARKIISEGKGWKKIYYNKKLGGEEMNESWAEHL